MKETDIKLWEDDIKFIEMLRTKNETLTKEIAELRKVEQDHQKINGELRKRNDNLKSRINKVQNIILQYPDDDILTYINDILNGYVCD